VDEIHCSRIRKETEANKYPWTYTKCRKVTVVS
jgi:hypothetical protein